MSADTINAKKQALIESMKTNWEHEFAANYGNIDTADLSKLADDILAKSSSIETFLADNWDAKFAAHYGDRAELSRKLEAKGLDMSTLALELAKQKSVNMSAATADEIADSINLNMVEAMGKTLDKVSPTQDDEKYKAHDRIPEEANAASDTKSEAEAETKDEEKPNQEPVDYSTFWSPLQKAGGIVLLPAASIATHRALADHNSNLRRLGRTITRKKNYQPEIISMQETANAAAALFAPQKDAENAEGEAKQKAERPKPEIDFSKVELLLRISPELANTPAVAKALKDVAKEAGLDLETFMKLSQKDLPIENGKHKGIKARQLAMAVFVENSPLSAANGLIGFVPQSVSRSGKVNSISFFDEKGISYTHKEGGTSVKLPKGARYNAAVALKEMEVHLAHVSRYNADGSVEPVQLNIDAHGKNPTYARDLALLSAMKMSLDKNIPVQISFGKTPSMTLDGMMNAGGPTKLFNNDTFVLGKMNKEAVASMERQGINVEKLIEQFNASYTTADNTSKATLSSPLTAASNEEQAQEAPKANKKGFNAKGVLFAASKIVGKTAAPVVNTLQENLRRIAAQQQLRKTQPPKQGGMSPV